MNIYIYTCDIDKLYIHPLHVITSNQEYYTVAYPMLYAPNAFSFARMLQLG